MSQRPVVSLISDFGLADEYVGVLKGVILSQQPDVTIVDICHTIPPQDIDAAAFILSRAYPFFPADTIFLVIVDPGVGSERHILALEWAGRIFIGPDNGILSPILRAAGPELLLYRILTSTMPQPVSATFHGRDIMAPLAGLLASGLPISRFGTKISANMCNMLPQHQLEISPSQVTGTIIHIDAFGNLCTSITQAVVNNFALPEALSVRVGTTVIAGIHRYYAERKGLIALWDSHDHLEIALPGGSARDMLQAKRGDQVKVVKA